MLKSESHGADFSFDRIGLIPSICRHQSSIQDLLAFLQLFNVLSYGAIHKVALGYLRQRKIQTGFIPRTKPAVLSQAPVTLAPMRRFSLAGEQQDSDTARAQTGVNDQPR